MLLARTAAGLRPMFGAGSAARHAGSGGHEIAAATLPSVHRDVDSAADLRAAVILGVGPATSRALAALGAARPQAG